MGEFVREICAGDFVGKVEIKRTLYVILTGGRSAERLMLAWSALLDFKQINNVDFFLRR